MNTTSPSARAPRHGAALLCALLAGAMLTTAVTACSDATDSAAPAPTETPAQSSIESADTDAPTTVVPSTGAPSTTNAFSDVEIADRMLLDGDEYSPGWQVLAFKQYLWDQQVAATVPGCATYIDSVFSADDPPNTTATRWFHAPPGRAGAMGQWVVVLPTEADATTLFDAVTAPDFVADCRLPYMDAAKASPELFCCDPSVAAVPPVYPDAVDGYDPVLGYDQLEYRTDPAQYWTDSAGVLHGPETVDSVAVRVGRVVVMMEAIITDEFGEPFIPREQFRLATATVIERAIHALGGVEH
jgi:hypothetical protein